jgi:apolipoprotein N-acyltransferase
VVDARARALRAGPLFEPWVHAQTVIVPKNAGTFYSRHGDLFAQAASGVALAMMIAAWRRKERRLS